VQHMSEHSKMAPQLPVSPHGKKQTPNMPTFEEEVPRTVVLPEADPFVHETVTVPFALNVRVHSVVGQLGQMQGPTGAGCCAGWILGKRVHSVASAQASIVFIAEGYAPPPPVCQGRALAAHGR